MNRAIFVSALLLATAVATVSASARELQQAGTPTSATLTIDFDNSIREVTGDKRNAVLNTLAQYVFQCKSPKPGDVKITGGLDTGVLLGDQSVVTFQATCVSATPQTVYDNCVANTKERWFGLGSSTAQREVEKATDTWWPNDKVDIQQATCSRA